VQKSLLTFLFQLQMLAVKQQSTKITCCLTLHLTIAYKNANRKEGLSTMHHGDLWVICHGNFCNLMTLHFAATCLWAFCNCSALHIFCITYLCQSLLHMHKFSVIPNQKSNVSLIGPPLNQSGLTHWVRGCDEKSTRKGTFYFSGEHCLLMNPQTLSLDLFQIRGPL